MSKRIEWAGHVWRSNGIIKTILEGKVDGKRPRGWLRQHWIDRVNDDLNKCSQRIMKENSIDTVRWKNVVEAAKVFQGLQKLKKKKKKKIGFKSFFFQQYDS